MSSSSPVRIWVCLVSLALAAPQGVAAAPGTASAHTGQTERRAVAVVTYDGGKVTLGELEDAYAAANPLVRERSSGPLDWLETTLRQKLFEREAARRGYAEEPRVRQHILQLAIDLMLDVEVNQPLRAFSPSQEQLAQYFKAHERELSAPELRRVFEMVVGTEAQARALLPRFKAAQGAAMRELVNEHSIDPTSRREEGYSRYFDSEGALADGEHGVDKALAKAAFALPEIGATSGVIALAGNDKGKFAIIKLAAVRPAYVPTFQQALPVVRKRVLDERRAHDVDLVVEKARGRFSPVVHYELLEQLPAEIAAPAQPEP